MIGLLHRLAARAAATAAGRRPDARLPPGGTGPAFPAAATAAEPAFAAAPRAPAPMPWEAVPPHAGPHVATPLEGSHVETPLPHADPAPSAIPAGPDPRAPFPDAAPRRVDAPVPPRMIDVSIDDGTARSARAESGPEPADRAAVPHPPHATGRDGAVRAVQVVRDPPLMVPLPVANRAPVPGAFAPAAMTAAAAVAPNGVRTEPDEVHIHIGRLEGTAVQDGPAARRRPQPARPPMSLDAYFARRGRG